MGLPARQLDIVSQPTIEGEGGGVQPPLPNLVQPVVVPPSPPRARPRMPQARLEVLELLQDVGVDAAVGVAWQFEPAQIRAAVVRWEERNLDLPPDKQLGPGWIVWRLRQGPMELNRHQEQTNYWWERYQRGKRILAERRTE